MHAQRPVFEEMAKRLADKGFERSHIQIREKIKQLKQRYKKVQDDNNRSGIILTQVKHRSTLHDKKPVCRVKRKNFNRG